MPATYQLDCPYNSERWGNKSYAVQEIPARGAIHVLDDGPGGVEAHFAPPGVGLTRENGLGILLPSHFGKLDGWCETGREKFTQRVSQAANSGTA